MFNTPSKEVRCFPRMKDDAGIAIGPILFIIAILGILAAAIAAGSGSFSTGTATESAKAKAVALIDIGQTLKLGFERIVGRGIYFDSVDLDPTHTTATDDLYSPSGGGISPPSVTMAETPASDAWMYPLLTIPSIGSSSGSRVALIEVAEDVCDQVNILANALAAGTADTDGAALGDFSSASLNTVAAWPANFDGKMTGCVENTTAATAGFFFYQVIGVQ